MSTVISVHRSIKPRAKNLQEVAAAQQFLLAHIKKPENNTVLTSGTVTPELQNIIDKTALIMQDSISKPHADQIELVKGGVVGDNYLFVPEVFSNGYVKRRFNEVNIFTQEELTRLNLQFGTNVLPGGVGENIMTSGIDIDSLPTGTLLGIGDTVVRIAGRRSFCWKFVGTFIKKEFYKPGDFKRFNIHQIGRATQTVTPGTVRPGDSIQIIKLGTGPSYHTTLKMLIQFEVFKSESDIDPFMAWQPQFNGPPWAAGPVS